MNFAKFLRTPFLTDHLRWLLLYKHHYHDSAQCYIFPFTFILKELRNYRLFLCPPQNWRKINQHSKLLFSKINLQFDTSDQISPYRKLNLLPVSIIYLVVFSLEMQKRLLQTKAYYKLCFSVRKETSHKHLKVAAAKRSFLNVYIIDTTCFNECFLFCLITRRHYFFMQIYRYPEIL